MGLKVLVAESQEVLRVGLRAILTSDTRVSEVYEAMNEKDLQRYLLTYQPDLTVVNQDLLADISTLQTKKFVILATELNMTKLKIAYEYGAYGYLSVNVSAELLCTMLRPTKDTFLIEPTIAPIVMEYLFDKNKKIPPAINETLLTPREREIVCLLREGHDRSSIARRLCIADTTLKTHIKNISQKRTKTLYIGKKGSGLMA